MTSRGFTLLELLVALAVMALLAGLLFAGLRTGIDGLARVERLAEATEDRRVVGAFLRQRLEAAEPALEHRPEGAAVAFAGEADRLDFVSPLPVHLGDGLPHRLRLWRDPAAGVMLAWQPLPAAATEPLPERRRVLLAGVDVVGFNYFGRRAGDPAAAWHSAWRGELTLPSLVRVDIDGQPPLIVALPRELAAR